MFIPKNIYHSLSGFSIDNDSDQVNQCYHVDEIEHQFYFAKKTGVPRLSNDEMKSFFTVYRTLCEVRPNPFLTLFGLTLLRGAENETEQKKAIEILKDALERKNVVAGYILAGFYKNNKSERIADTTIFDWYFVTAQQYKDYPPALYEVGLCYQQGRGTPKSLPLTLQYFKEAAMRGYSPAQYKMGMLCLSKKKLIHKLGTIQYLESAAVQGYNPALHQLGLCYLNGIVTIKDIPRAIKYFEEAARLGYAPALYQLGLCYLNGIGTNKDIPRAIKYFEDAAKLGNASALYQLGLCYLNGIGTIQDLPRAKKYFEDAANQGSTPALYQLGLCYLNGIGTNQNLSLAIEYFINAGDKEYAAAQHQLGEIYTLTQPDALLAVYWFERAAKLGHTISQFNLGYLYAIGQGVQINYLAATSWFIKAAEEGYPPALHYLGMCYIYGFGVETNYCFGLEYIQVSARINANIKEGAGINIPGVEKDLIRVINLLTFINETDPLPDLDRKNLSQLIQIAKNIRIGLIPNNHITYIKGNLFEPPQPLFSSIRNCNTKLPPPSVLQNQL